MTRPPDRRTERRDGPCELCGRSKPLSFHHPIPRHLPQAGGITAAFLIDDAPTASIFAFSHGGIHDLIPDEDKLGMHYRTRELLLAHESNT